MKKTMLIIVGFVLTLLTMSAFVDVRRSARIGSEAPTLVLERADSSLALDGLRGKIRLAACYGGEANLAGKRIAVWGLAFKPETDDMREAASLVTIDLLLGAGCDVRVFDPVAMDECRRRLGDQVEYAKDMYDAVLDADALLLLTEWKQFRLPSWGVVTRSMRSPLVIDGRNIYDAEDLAQQGIIYHCIGK